MATYVELQHVRTWYDERGEGEPLVLLHGGVVDARFFGPNIEPLAARFHVFAPDLRGHGHTPDVDGPFSYDALAEDTIGFLATAVGGPAHLVGHSVGAGVALHVAVRRPDLVRRLVLISGAFHHDGVIATDEIDVDQVVAGFGASYAEVSPDGEEHYPVVVKKVIEMDSREPAMTVSDLPGVTARTLVMASDDDVITLEHTLALYRGIRSSELAVVPGTSHFLLQEKPELCNTIVVDFLTDDPAATVAPMRRAQTEPGA
jgi:pimeloyl-ACP methyl ester carboxylesterase